MTYSIVRDSQAIWKIALAKTRHFTCQNFISNSEEWLYLYRVLFKATGGVFTSHAAQRSAEKAGMVCCYQISYKDFGKQCDIKFNTKTEYLKIYGILTA